MNESDLSFFYNKKSPTFLVEAAILVAALILRSYPIDSVQFQRFLLVVIIGCVA